MSSRIVSGPMAGRESASSRRFPEDRDCADRRVGKRASSRQLPTQTGALLDDRGGRRGHRHGCCSSGMAVRCPRRQPAPPLRRKDKGRESMTQVAEPGSAREQGERVGTSVGAVHHWIGGRIVEGTSGRHGRCSIRPPVALPARSTSRPSRRSTRRSPRPRGVPRLAGDVALEARPRSCSGSGTWSRRTAASSRPI